MATEADVKRVVSSVQGQRRDIAEKLVREAGLRFRVTYEDGMCYEAGDPTPRGDRINVEVIGGVVTDVRVG